MSVTEMPSQLPTSDFIKGMTLDEYMANLNCDKPQTLGEGQQEQQQNLYESSRRAGLTKHQLNDRQYCIQEIDQESSDDSFSNFNMNEHEEKEKEQLTKATFRQTKEKQVNRFRKLDQHSMNATACFNEPFKAANKFRVKNISNSPFHKKNNGETMNGSMTLYGTKFSLERGKESKKGNELATFYGKLPAHFDKTPKKVQIKANQSKAESKSRLDKLIQFQTKIKNNHSQRIYFVDIKIDGVRDKLAERKNKFA